MEIHHNEIAPGTVAVTVAGKVMMGAESEKIENLVEQLLREGKRIIIFDIGGVTTTGTTGRAQRPASVVNIPRRKPMQTTVDLGARRAMRTPISWVWCETKYAITP